MLGVCVFIFGQTLNHHSTSCEQFDDFFFAQVLTTFQPIAVSRFGWVEQQFAAVNFFSALASIAASLASAQLRLPEWSQVQACEHAMRCYTYSLMMNVRS